jgi:glucoamylase
MLNAMAAMTSGQGLEPEQVWEDPNVAPSPFGSDPTTASIGFTTGHPAGSASPLTWAQAQYARLALDLSAGHDLETPSITYDRYVAHGMPGAVPLTVTSPASGASVTSSTVTVTGTSVPGAQIDVEAQALSGGPAALASTRARPNGSWSVVVPASFGSTTITVTATSGDDTAYSQLSVTDVALPGTTVLSVTDPTGDDNGPGTYAYPTASNFQPGAFDLTGMQVSQTPTNVYVQVGIRNLAPTFGSDFGAQLLDLYIRNPAATSTSTDSAYPSVMNYSIAPADAWSELVEAQGFAPVIWNDAAGDSLGSATLLVDQGSGTATIVLPRAQFGTVGNGWVFTVALAGQGSGSPPVRSFTPLPGAYTFGVCASGESSPICAVNPSTVPTVMDTIPPTGVSQDTELDPLDAPVELQGVTVGG